MGERLLVLERALLGAGASAQEQPPFPRLAWLETQLGSSSGTLLERLNALEVAAKAQGLL